MWVYEPDGNDPYAEFCFVSKVDHAWAKVFRGDASAFAKGQASVKVIAGGNTYQSHIEIDVRADDEESGASVGVGVGPASAAFTLPGSPGGTSQPSGMFDKATGDECTYTYYEKLSAGMRAGLSANGLLFAASSGLSAKAVNKILIRDLGAVPGQCKEAKIPCPGGGG